MNHWRRWIELRRKLYADRFFLKKITARELQETRFEWEITLQCPNFLTLKRKLLLYFWGRNCWNQRHCLIRIAKHSELNYTPRWIDNLSRPLYALKLRSLTQGPRPQMPSNFHFAKFFYGLKTNSAHTFQEEILILQNQILKLQAKVLKLQEKL